MYNILRLIVYGLWWMVLWLKFERLFWYKICLCFMLQLLVVKISNGLSGLLLMVIIYSCWLLVDGLVDGVFIVGCWLLVWLMIWLIVIFYSCLVIGYWLLVDG